MKEVLSLVAFGIWALFFVVFFATLKPDIVIAGPGPKCAWLLRHEGFADARLPLAYLCRSDVARRRAAIMELGPGRS